METIKENLPEKKPLEHLKEGVDPIMACIGTRDDFEKEPTLGLTDRLGFWGENKQNLFVDYYAYPYENNAKGIKNAGEKTYAISEISDLNKFSLKYKNCTGVIVSGQDKTNGKNISFFTHQDSMKVLPEGEIRRQFLADLKWRLKEMESRCTPGTIDAVIFGGNYLDSDRVEKEHHLDSKVEFEKNYMDSIHLLSEQISDVLGFQPTMIAGPKTTEGNDDAIYDNEHRRLYLRRPKIGENSSESFKFEEAEGREEQWKKEWK